MYYFTVGKSEPEFELAENVSKKATGNVFYGYPSETYLTNSKVRATVKSYYQIIYIIVDIAPTTALSSSEASPEKYAPLVSVLEQ